MKIRQKGRINDPFRHFESVYFKQLKKTTTLFPEMCPRSTKSALLGVDSLR